MEEGTAVALLKRAVELDTACRYTEALVCYKEPLADLGWMELVGFVSP